MNTNIAMFIRCEDRPTNETISNEESLKLAVQAGFKRIFMSFKANHLFEGQYRKFYDLAKSYGLEIVFVHLGYQVNEGIATIWEEGTAGDQLVADYKRDLEIVAKDGIKMVCMHVTKSSKQSPMSKIGLKRWEEIVKHAEKLGVIVALENTVWPGYIEFILDNIQSPNLQVCFDSGHNHVYFKDGFDFKRFKNKIACIHLHDNDQSKDLHLLPFDGTIDWKLLAENLREANYKGVIACESGYKRGYVNELTPLEFFTEAYRRLEKIDDMVNLPTQVK